MTTNGTKMFFEYARLRQEAHDAKMRGVPKGQQSSDDVLNKYSFCNVFREDDRTTIWCRENVREAYKNSPWLIPAIVTFRMFNRIDMGEAVFSQHDMFDGGNAFDHMMQDKTLGNVKILRRAVKALKPNGPYATGAYIISSPPGYDKLDGVLEVIRRFVRGSSEYPGCGEMGWADATAFLHENRNRPSKIRLEEAWTWFRQFDYLGNFHSYEIVTDLRHTRLLRRASDVMTWANPGPGCKRGLNRVFGRKLGERIPRDQMMTEMQVILDLSASEKYWPKKWSSWEMRDVEHTLCEFDKWRRTHDGDGRPRGVYR